MMLKKAIPLASLLLLLGAQGCNVSVSSTDSCSQDTSYTCRDGNPAYYCTGSATPQMSGYGCESTGYGDYCCYLLTEDTCVASSTVGCVAAAQGYTCTGTAQPEYYTSGDVCSTDGAGNYCCWSSQCHYDNSVTARCGSATGYSCTGGQTPYSADPNLVCSEGATGRGGETEYCCYTQTSAAPATSTCTQDATVTGCQLPSYGFSCTGSDTPDEDYSNLTCSTPTSGSGATLYCCQYQ